MQDFYTFHGTNRQTFAKYYNRHRLSGADDRLLLSDDRLLPSDDRLLLANDRQQRLPARAIQVQSSLHHSLMTQLLPDR